MRGGADGMHGIRGMHGSWEVVGEGEDDFSELGN
jgi:hypothetical protein